MAAALILIHRYFARVSHPPNTWLHVPRYLHDKRTLLGDWAKLRFWGFIEQKPEIRDDGSDRAGLWRITAIGSHFACGQSRVPHRAVLYNDELLGFDLDKWVSIHDALKKKFNYAELMK